MDSPDDHDAGLHVDLTRWATLLSRRHALRLLAGTSAGVGFVPLLGCGPEENSTDGGTTACTPMPAETAGPYPGDGSNGANALSLSGIVRSDLRTSIGSASGTAPGIPLTVNLTLVNTNAGCAGLSGVALYAWHCTRDGLYSMYSQSVQNENFLRGVQVTDATGSVTFQTIFPGCYSGRWPHIHFEVYPSAALATSSANTLVTSQLALPKSACDSVYATAGYEASVSHLAQTSLTTDMVFRDGVTTQLATVTGNTSAGFVANLTVGVSR